MTSGAEALTEKIGLTLELDEMEVQPVTMRFASCGDRVRTEEVCYVLSRELSGSESEAVRRRGRRCVLR